MLALWCWRGEPGRFCRFGGKIGSGSLRIGQIGLLLETVCGGRQGDGVRQIEFLRRNRAAKKAATGEAVAALD
mgnify:FL=1